MPDWTYHPVWRPAMFRLTGEDARRLTVGYLDLQGRTRIGRELFRLLSYGFPDEDEGVDVVGLRFRSRVGVGPGLDLQGRAGPVLQFLGSGFVLVGPTTVDGLPRNRELDPSRIRQHTAITWSEKGYLPAEAVVRACLERRRRVIKVPVGIVVAGTDPSGSVGRLASLADFLTVPDAAELSPEVAAATRSATSKPLLSRIRLDGTDEEVVAHARRARNLGYDGVVLDGSEVYAGLADGRVAGPAGVQRLVSAVRAVTALSEGDVLPVVAAGGMVTPEDVVACLDAGASLVEVSTGFVYSGPGIVARSLRLRATRSTSTSNRPVLVSGRPRVAWWSVVLALLASAMAAVPSDGLAALPTWLVVTSSDQWAQAAATGGLAALFELCVALVRRAQEWAWWPGAAVAALVGLASPVVGATGLLLVLLTGRESLLRGFRPLFEAGVSAWRWSPANLGRRALQVGAAAGVLAVLTSGASAGTRGLVAGTSFLGLLLVQRGLRPGVRSAWLALLAWGPLTTLAVAALLPGVGGVVAAAVGGLVCLVGLSWLCRPLWVSDERTGAFPDV